MSRQDLPSPEYARSDENSVALIFPGQGSQFPGMSSDLSEGSDITREMLRRADECLGYSLSTVMGGHPPGELDKTCYTQPAVFVHSVAMYEELRSRYGLKPFIAAGHSLGEYTALCAAGTLRFEDALEIIRVRAQAMDEAQSRGVFGMAAILGLDHDRCVELVHEARGSEVLEIANINAPDQIVVSGHLCALQRAIDATKKEKRVRAVPLNVSSAFHTPLMEPAVAKLRTIVDATPLGSAAFPVLANVDARPYPAEAALIRERLVLQVVRPVLWSDCIRHMASLGVSRFVEVGPGKVLTGLVRRIDRTLKTCNVSTISECLRFVEDCQ